MRRMRKKIDVEATEKSPETGIGIDKHSMTEHMFVLGGNIPSTILRVSKHAVYLKDHYTIQPSVGNKGSVEIKRLKSTHPLGIKL